MKADDKQKSAEPAVANTIDQVRELLFGADKRATDTRLADLDAKMEKALAELRADMTARFVELENRLEATRADLETSRLSSIDDIGAAIANLGASVRNLGAAKPKGR